MEFQKQLAQKAKWMDEQIEIYFQKMPLSKNSAVAQLANSMKYSAGQGGKRVRPILSILVAETMNESIEKVIPFCIAVEMIHTYSLIHDDLPCMDNDDFRRGQPTNHKVFGEATALLAGDALLTESFYLLSHAYSENPKLALKLIQLTSEAAGILGMVGGQAIDLAAQKSSSHLDEVLLIHQLKTGAMIRLAAEGAACICTEDAQIQNQFRKYGELLGLAFQIADDVLDYNPEKIEPGSFPALMGIQETQNYLKKVTDEAIQTADKISANAAPLKNLAQYNQNRSI